MTHSIKDLIMKNRSYRRFRHDKPITETQLQDLVELARLSPSAANLQPLKYVLSCTPKKNENRLSALSLSKQKAVKSNTGGTQIKPTMCRNAP